MSTHQNEVDYIENVPPADDSQIVEQLLAKQDEVLEELDHLNEKILSLIVEISGSRAELLENLPDCEAA
jgi:hypothetical protein